MKPENVIGALTAVTAAAALCGCAGAPMPQHITQERQQATAELGIARNAWAQCVRAAIPPLDEPQSPSEAVARAAMKGCSDRYTDMMQALARTLAPACGRNPDCTSSALAKAAREATQDATDDVVTSRVRVAGAQVLKCE